MKRLKISLLSFSVLLFTGCTSDQATITPDTSLETVPSQFVLYGEVKAHQKEEINIDFPAKVTAVHVENGDNVQKGEPLISLDLEDYKLQIATKEKEIQMDEVQLKQLIGNDNAQYAQLSSIKEQLQLKEGYIKEGTDPDVLALYNTLPALKEAATLSKQVYETNLSLFEAHSLSAHALETSKQDYEAKLKELENVQLSIEKIKANRKIEVANLTSQLKSTQVLSSNIDLEKQTSIEMLQLKIEANKLTLENMKKKLEKDYLKENDIIALTDNLIVYDIECSKGSYVAGVNGLSPTPLLKAVSRNTLYVIADIPEESLSQVTAGVPVSIILADDNKDLPAIKGTVEKISEQAVEKDGDTVVEASIEVQTGVDYLKPGLSVDILITLP